MAASIRYTTRIVVFVGALVVALLFFERRAHADAPSQASAPAPDQGAAGPPASGTTSTTAPAGGATTAPSTASGTPATGGASTSPPPSASASPGGGAGAGNAPSSTTAPGTASGASAAGAPTAPAGPADAASARTGSGGGSGSAPGPASGSNATQQASATTSGTAVANTGTNAAGAAGASSAGTGTTNGAGSGAAPKGTPNGGGPNGTTAGTSSAATVTSGPATGQGTVDQNAVRQGVQADVTDDAHVQVLQVALVINIGIGVAGSGGNVAQAGAGSAGLALPQGSPVATGPTPAQIATGGATSTGNAGTTNVTQSIVLTGPDVTKQLATVLNLGVGVGNSGLNFAVGVVAGPNGAAPSSVTLLTFAPVGTSAIDAGSANALGNRSTNAILQLVLVKASGKGSLSVVQRAVIVNFGVALANSGLNLAPGGAMNVTMPDVLAAEQLIRMLLDPSGAASGGGAALVPGSSLGPLGIGTGPAGATGNDTVTGISQKVQGSVAGTDVASALQQAFVGNFGIALANSGGNGVGGPLGAAANRAAFAGAQDALRAFLSGILGFGSPLQSLDATFQLGTSLLQLHGDVRGTEALMGVDEAGAPRSGSGASLVVRQLTAVLDIGIALGDSGHNNAVSLTLVDPTLVNPTADPAALVADALIRTGDATAVGNHFATTICQTVGDALACAPAPAPPPPPTGTPAPPPQVSPAGVAVMPAPPAEARTAGGGAAIAAATLPFTGAGVEGELAGAAGLIVSGSFLRRRARRGRRARR